MQSDKSALLALGGRTTLFYVREINQRLRQQSSAEMTSNIVLKKTDFEKTNEYLPNQFNELEVIFNNQLAPLNDFQSVIVPNITAHETIDRLLERPNFSCPIVHPVTSVIAKLKSDGCDKIKLISSQYGMNSNYLNTYFTRNDIEVIVPNQEDQTFFEEFRKKVYDFRENSTDVNQYLSLLANYQQDNKIVVACTELSLMLPSATTNIYDMSRIQIDQAIVNNQ